MSPNKDSPHGGTRCYNITNVSRSRITRDEIGRRIMSRSKALKVRRLGRLEYAAALSIQKETECAVREGRQPDTLLFVEHPHTLTLGRIASHANILAAPEDLAERDVTVFETNRGGKVTYHGLGQLVCYPIINLSPDRKDVHRYVRDLEEVLMRALLDFRIESFRIKGLTGVHTTRGKVAAIGIHIARWITTHGFALNVNTDLSFFDLIIACEGEHVTSMNELLEREINPREVEDSIIEHFADVFAMTPEEFAAEESDESGSHATNSIEASTNLILTPDF